MRNRSFFLSQYAGDLDAPATPQQIVAPDLTVADTLRIDLGRRTLQLRAWPTAHSACDLTILDEASHTLWTGDLLFRGRLPAMDGDVMGWLEVIDTLAQLEVSHAIPGHGPPTTDLRGALRAESGYLQALLTDVRSAGNAGESLQQAIDGAAQDERSHWLLWDSTHPRNVTRVYEQLEWQ
jgi:glyoxylase-like metal-dependent hydrolase (beta-lactamase superfamily II)